MANIVVNKNFNKKYLYRFIQALFKPTNTGYTGSFNTSDAFVTGTWSTFKLPFITKHSTLLTLEKISKHYNDIVMDATDIWNDLGSVMGSVLSGDETYRAHAMETLVTNGVITQAEYDDFVFFPLTDEPVINTSTDDNGIMTFSFTNVNKLVTRYVDADKNVGSEQLYICFALGHSHRFNGMDISVSNIDYNYFSTGSGITKQCFPYVAVSIGTEGTEDVVLDYTGIIDYLDDFEIQLQIPKQIS